MVCSTLNIFVSSILTSSSGFFFFFSTLAYILVSWVTLTYTKISRLSKPKMLMLIRFSAFEVFQIPLFFYIFSVFFSRKLLSLLSFCCHLLTDKLCFFFFSEYSWNKHLKINVWMRRRREACAKSELKLKLYDNINLLLDEGRPPTSLCLVGHYC